MSTSPRAAAALLIVGALFAGVVLGIAGDRAWLWHTHQMMPRHSPRFGQLLVEHLDHELNFTPQQKQMVAQIVERLSVGTNAGMYSVFQPPTAAQFLASWFRPISASLAALSLVAALGTAYYVQTRDQVTMDSMASNSVEITVDGATYSVD